MSNENPERLHPGPTILFGYAIRTPHARVLGLEGPYGSLGEAAADYVYSETLRQSEQFTSLPQDQQSSARNLLRAGIDDTGRIVRPYIDQSDPQASSSFAHHPDTIATIAALARNRERAMRGHIASNMLTHRIYDEGPEGRGLVMKTDYYPIGKGCPFAGEHGDTVSMTSEPRPLFVKFSHWAIDLVIADLEQSRRDVW